MKSIEALMAAAPMCNWVRGFGFGERGARRAAQLAVASGVTGEVRQRVNGLLR